MMNTTRSTMRPLMPVSKAPVFRPRRRRPTTSVQAVADRPRPSECDGSSDCSRFAFRILGLGARRPERTPPRIRSSSPAPGVETPAANAAVPPAVRIVDSRATSPHTVSPETSTLPSDRDRFEAAQAVIVNLQHADRDLRRRIVDFASGLCYALGGSMERVADQVYLLVPTDVEVSDADTRRAFE